MTDTPLPPILPELAREEAATMPISSRGEYLRRAAYFSQQYAVLASLCVALDAYRSLCDRFQNSIDQVKLICLGQTLQGAYSLSLKFSLQASSADLPASQLSYRNAFESYGSVIDGHIKQHLSLHMHLKQVKSVLNSFATQQQQLQTT